MKITVLASGSGGNTTYLETDTTKILLDCGITHRQIVQRLRERDLVLDNLNAIFVTHEHSDHIKGVDVTMKRTKAKTYMTEDTFNSLFFKTKDNVDYNRIEFVIPYEKFVVGDVTVQAISISHDAKDAVGYVLYHEDKKIVYITDIGYLPNRDHEILQNADFYIFESNYDVTMLFTSNRPFYLKQRIDSVKGHMSNTDSAYNMSQLVGDKTKQIVLAHRSRECNTNELVLETYTEVFKEYGLNVEDYNIVVASQDIPTDVFNL